MRGEEERGEGERRWGEEKSGIAREEEERKGGEGERRWVILHVSVLTIRYIYVM